MTTCLVSYATQEFEASRDRLVASALQHDIESTASWNRADLERTPFYRVHGPILNAERGGGYWLWKPFIIKETLTQMGDGDILCYADAGIEVVADLSPLFRLCENGRGILLFAGHYDDVGAPGPNTCGKWTKRDCFVYLNCDGSHHYDAPMLDASFLVVRKSLQSVAFIHEWLLCCSQPHLLTDLPNICGLSNLPQFIQHRHDQSILSLLAMRHALEILRHPSQYGNHAKAEPYRINGEPRRYPYGTKGIFHNSPYGTLLHHHRNRVEINVRRILRCPRENVFKAWSDPHELIQWFPDVMAADLDCRRGGRYRLTATDPKDGSRLELSGTYLDVSFPERLVYTWRCVRDSAVVSPQTRVTVVFEAGADENVPSVQSVPIPSTEIVLTHEIMPKNLPEDMRQRFHAKYAAAWNSWLDRLSGHLVGAPVGAGM